MARLCILHISDFHYGLRTWQDAKVIIDQFVADLEHCRTVENQSPDLIIFSGDLVNAGETAKDFTDLDGRVIAPLLATTKLTRDELITAPGNHDINRQFVRDNPEAQNGLLSTLTNRDKVNSFCDKMMAADFGHFYFQRLSNFANYSNQFAATRRIRRTPFFDSYMVNVSDLRVGVVGFNTAWLSDGEPGDKDSGRLLIPERAIMAAIDDTADADVRIATFHHPFHYLAEQNRIDAKSLLTKNFNLVCTGHLHHSEPEMVQTPRGRFVHSAGGALYAHRDYYNGYCFITLDTNSREAEFIFRKWEDSPTYSFVAATNVAPDGKQVLQWGDPTEVARVGTLIDVNKALRPFLVEQANEHLLSSHANTAAPKSFEEIFVEPPIADRPHFETTSLKATRKDYVLLDVLNSAKPILLYGAREIGKSMLAYGLALKACDGATGNLKVPVLIDLDKVSAGSGIIAREARKILGYAGLQGQFAELNKAGSFTYIFDNYTAAERRKHEMIVAFIKSHPSNGYVLLADEKPGLFKVKQESDDETLNTLYIHPLHRKAVRELTKRWLEPSGQYSTQAFHTVLKKIQNSNLPASGYVVSMIAWSIERQNMTGLINEAALLERFVDAILNKYNPREVERSANDYTIKVAFLSALAHELHVRSDFVIEKNELVKFALAYIESRVWQQDAAAFVEELITTGALMCFGTSVAFRYRCLREYFLAVYLSENGPYLNEVLKKENYLSFSRELDILTGLHRSRDDVVRTIEALTDQAVAAHINPGPLSFFDKVSVKAETLAVMTKPTSLSELDVSDETIERMLDEAGEVGRQGTASSDLDQEKKAAERAEKMLDLAGAFASIHLMSKVVRNSELLSDPAYKIDVTRKVVSHWAKFIGLLLGTYERLTSTDAELIEKWEKLSDKTKHIIEWVVKIMLPVALSWALYEALGTDKLFGIFERLLDDPDQPTLIKLLLISLLADLTYSEQKQQSSAAISKIEKFIKQAPSPYVKEILSHQLWMLYLTPNIGEANRRKVEDMYAETRLRAVEGGKYLRLGSPKSKFQEELRKQRDLFLDKADPDPDSDDDKD